MLIEDGELNFPCGKNGEIVGTVLNLGKSGCTYTLDRDVKAFKKLRRFQKDSLASDSTVVEITIPKGTKIVAPWKRNSRAHLTFAYYNMCRAEKAIVGKLSSDYRYTSMADKSFTYQPGQKVVPTEPFSDDPDSEESSGIYFFFEPRFADQWVI